MSRHQVVINFLFSPPHYAFRNLLFLLRTWSQFYQVNGTGCNSWFYAGQQSEVTCDVTNIKQELFIIFINDYGVVIVMFSFFSFQLCIAGVIV